MYKAICLTLLLQLINQSVFAEPLKQEFRFNEAFSTDVSKITNQASVNSSTKIRDNMQGKVTTIPATWRLVNGTVKPPGEYVMFFQDKDGGVYTLEVSASGLIGGGNFLSIPARSN